ncbi:transcriptional regulator FtsR [Corynebacterium sp. 335C]
MAALAARGTSSGEGGRGPSMSIGKVVEILSAEFPDIRHSKVRFLDEQGVVVPERTEAGYRRYYGDDVERLRYVLTLQRDQYLPLKVIREQLDRFDEAQAGEGSVTPIVRPGSFASAPALRLTAAELAERAGVDESWIGELAAAKMLFPDAMGMYRDEDAAIASAAGQLRSYGLDVRHLRSLRSSVRREADLIAGAVAPLARSRRDDAADTAEERSREMAQLVTRLHAAWLQNEVGRGTGR